jgi:ABC-type transport system involved in cytochrome c biogenesis permease component
MIGMDESGCFALLKTIPVLLELVVFAKIIWHNAIEYMLLVI